MYVIYIYIYNIIYIYIYNIYIYIILSRQIPKSYNFTVYLPLFSPLATCTTTGRGDRGQSKSQSRISAEES